MRCAVLLGVMLVGCARVNEAPDAYMRDAGPPDPAASMNCRASLLLPRGTYWVGSDVLGPGMFSNAAPAHQVTLSRDAWVATYEATNACYRACMDSGACDVPAGFLPETYLAPERSRFPIIGLYQEQAAAYCVWLGGRLLTEAEWEAMARGADGRAWPWYPPPTNPRRPEDGPRAGGEICENADFSPSGQCPGYVAKPVGSVAPRGRGPFGHEDVVTNATEWVLGTLVFPYPSGPQVDPILEGGEYPVGRRSPIERLSYGDTARCLFTSPPEPLYVQE